MKNKKSGLFKMITRFFFLVMIVGYFANNIVDTTYAVITQKNPDVIITIHNDGSITQKGNLFGDDLWYPDKKESGIIRINNQFKRIKVTNLGLGVDLRAVKEGYDQEEVYRSFLDNMKLTIKKGRLLIFDDDILDNKSFLDLLYKPNDNTYNGFVLEGSGQFSISKNDFIDLEYTLQMDEQAGKELQALMADVSFLINVNENENPSTNPKNNHHNTDEHWAHDCIQTLLDHEIDLIHNDPDGEIRPDDHITRAEAAALIADALEIKPKYKLFSGYKDQLPKWARGRIIAVSEAGIFEGYPDPPESKDPKDRVFKPNNNITREELTTVLVKAFNKQLDKDIELKFNDKGNISPWALRFVKRGVHNEIIVGYPDKTFKPQNNMTRAEAFTITCKLLGYHEEHKK